MEPVPYPSPLPLNQAATSVTLKRTLEWLTASEAASHLRVNTRTLLRWVRERKLKGYALSGTKRRIWRFLRDDLDSTLLQQSSPIEISAQHIAEPTGMRYQHLDSTLLQQSSATHISAQNLAKPTRLRYQRGSVVFNKRSQTWHYLWRDGGHRRSKLIGTKAKFSTKSAAWEAAVSLHLTERAGRKEHTAEDTVTVKSLVVAYRLERMPTRIDTRRSYEVWLEHYILPTFGNEPITSVQARNVELWLNRLNLSPKSKVHIRGLLRILWDYAQWRGDAPAQRNPMELVSIKNATKRVHPRRSLNPEEFRRFAASLEEPFRFLALLCVSLGLRISEALALKWEDFDSTAPSVRIERAIVCQNVDEVKSTRSKRILPIGRRLLTTIEKHRRAAAYSAPNNWVFASPVQKGRLPWSYDQIWRVYQTAAKAAGIGALGTHTLRHTYRSWLDAVGTSIAVQQKLMRHADIRTTMNIYGDVVTDEMQVANKKVLRLALKRPVEKGKSTR